MSVATLGMATLVSNQMTAIKAIDEKMSLQGVQTQISNVLTSPAFCGCLIGANTFNYTTTAWNGFPTSISYSYDGTCTAVGGALLTVGSNIGNSNLKPTAMGMQNITETTAGSGNFSANLVLQFDSTLLTISRKPLSIPMYFKVNMADPVAARNLVSCGSSASGSTGWSLSGNSGTDATNFIGTTDGVDVLFKRNNIIAGTLKPSSTSFGVRSLPTASTGAANSAFGNGSLQLNTTGENNVALGSNAMFLNTVGSRNTASGTTALSSNTTGTDNSAFGYRALAQNTAGWENTAVGSQALYLNTGNMFNSAFGFRALFSTTGGSYNTAVGQHANSSNINGHGNTAIGAGALQSATTGSYNTALGYGSGVSIETLNHSVAIGSGAIANASNKVRIGNAMVTVIEGQVAWTSVSDARLKRDVKPYPYGLAFVRELRPVSFIFRSDATRKRQMGFIAQEVEATRFPFYGLKKPKSEKDYYSMTYSDFVMPLVNSVQELDRQNTDLRKEISDLRLEIETIRRLLEKRSGPTDSR